MHERATPLLHVSDVLNAKIYGEGNEETPNDKTCQIRCLLLATVGVAFSRQRERERTPQ